MSTADARRRWFGLLFLILAGGMLIWGLTLLDRHLVGWGFVVYWLVCLLFTLAAMMVALIDWRAVRAARRAEQTRGQPPLDRN
jgi:hypothetical protein